MLVRVGTCQVCEATYQLPLSFEGSWASCRICQGAVLVGAPVDAEQALKRSARKSGKGEPADADKARTARGAAAGAQEAAAGAHSTASKDSAGRAAAPAPAAPAPTAPAPTAPAPTAPAPAAPAAARPAAAGAVSNAPANSPAAPGSAPAAAAAANAPSAAPAPAAQANPRESTRPAPSGLPESPRTTPAEAPKWSPKALEAELQAERARAKSTPPAPAPAPAPAALVEEMSLEELEPPIATRPSTLERLKAERAAAARANQGGTSAASSGPAPSAKAPSTLERLKAERARAAAPQGEPSGRSPAPAPAPSRGSSPARSERPAAKSGTRQDRAEPDAPAGRGSGRRSRGPSPSGRKGPHPMVAVGSLALVGGLTALAFQMGWLGKSKEPQAAPAAGAEQGAQAAPAPAAPAPVVAGGDPFAAGLGGLSPAATPGAGSAAALAPAGAPAGSGAGQTSAAAQPPAAPSKPKSDPSSVNLGAYGPFEPLAETSDEDWQKLEGWTRDLLNPNAGAEAGRARSRLTEAGKAAFPALLNGLLALDYGTRDAMDVGNVGVQVLERICRGTNFGWRTSEDPKEVEYFNKRVIETWAQRWQAAAVDEAAWAKLAKLDQGDEGQDESGQDG